MQCTNCGNEVPDTAKVCGHCGHRLKAGMPIPVTKSTAVKQGLPGWAWGLVGGLVLVSGIAIFAVMQLLKVNTPADLLPTNPPPVAIPTQVPTFTQAPPTLTPLPTATLGPQWVTVYENSDLQEVTGTYMNLATTNGSFRITFQYEQVNRSDFRNCNLFAFDVMDHFGPSLYDWLEVSTNRDSQFWVDSPLNDDRSHTIIRETTSAALNSSKVTFQVEARDDYVTIRANDQTLAGFEFPISDRKHELSLEVSGPFKSSVVDCSDLQIPDISELVVEELR